MKYKIDLEEVQAEHNLRNKVIDELNELDNVASFDSSKRIGIDALQGVGRAYGESIDRDGPIKLLNSMLKIIHKYYEAHETQIITNGDFVTIYFAYDCSNDGEDEVYCE